MSGKPPSVDLTSIAFQDDQQAQALFNSLPDVILPIKSSPLMKAYQADSLLRHPPKFDHAAQFLDNLFPQRIHTFQIRPDNPDYCSPNPRLTRIWHGRLFDLWGELELCNLSGACISFTVNETDGQGRRKENITRVRAIFVDLDGAFLSNLFYFPFIPHAIVETSPGRYHVYWLIDGLPREQFRPAQLALARLLKGDESVIDLSRAMRLPGTFHCKDPDHVYRSRTIYLRAGDPYAASEVLAALELKPQAPRVRYPREDIPKGKRNSSLYKRACKLLAQGMSQRQILKKITRINRKRCHPPLSSSELASIVKNARKYAPPRRIRFRWAPDRSRQAIRRINRVLAKSDQIFQRFGVPAVIRNVTPSSVLSFIKGVKIPMIIPITPSYSELLIEKYINFYVPKKGMKSGKSIGVPSGIAKKFIELPAQDLKLPQVNLLLSCPTLRPDGSLLQRPGYDKETGIYLLMKEEWKPINPTPSEEDARAALARLLKLLEHFPFVRECHKSVIIAAILTAIVRHCFRQTPAFGASAPMYATGKSLLMDIVALILTGKRAPAYHVSGKEDEIDKFLISAMVCGMTIISIDNFNSKAVLKSEALSSFITQEEKMGRLLVTNKIVIAPTNVTVLINGNNLTISEDLTSRTLIAKIDAKKEHPERRKIELDLFEYIPIHRQRYVRDALTIILYHLNSEPLAQQLPRFGRFEQWSHWIRESLVRLGMEDPCKTLREAAEEDPGRSEIVNFLQACYIAFANEKILLRDIIRDAANAASGGILDDTADKKRKATALRALQDILERVAKDKNGTISVKQLENWLRSFKGRIVQGLKIQPTKKKSMYGVKWQIVQE
jgi:hypothetical protein